MKENSDGLNDIQEVNLESFTDSILFQNFLNKKMEEKKELKLSKEINKKNIKFPLCLT